MPSFRHVCAHAPALVIDAASSEVQVGVLAPEVPARWFTSSEESGVTVFQGVKQLGVDPGRMGAFIFCDGPGSVLGIRTGAMALRTWTVLKPTPVFAYCSLGLIAHALGRDEVSVIADARRETWHRYRVKRGLDRAPASDLSGELLMPQHFRHWSQLPPNVQIVPYSLSALLPRIWDLDLLSSTDSPDAFLHEEPSYVKWTPQIHRAPTNS